MSGNAPNAILAISSTDRYTTYLGGNANQPASNTLLAQYVGTFQGQPYLLKNTQTSSNFQITAPGALLNGYIEKIIVSQIQLQYNLPTVIPGRNDTLYVTTQFQAEPETTYEIQIPYGFYTPAELAAILEVELNATVQFPILNPPLQFIVTYNPSPLDSNDNLVNNFFDIRVYDNGGNYTFYFPTPQDVFGFGNSDTDDARNLLRAYKLFGISIANAYQQANYFQTSTRAPDFLYTPYIDILSDALTNYQPLKDTDSSTFTRKGLVSRIYLSGIGSPQGSAFTTSLGCQPFILTYDLSSPKVIRWSPDTAVNSLDFQLRDCYGDLLFSDATYPNQGYQNYQFPFNTEFQMTLLCIED